MPALGAICTSNATMSIASDAGGISAAAVTGTCPVYPASWYTYSPTGVSCVPHTLTWDQFGCTPSPAAFY